jgi:hypothetical protein
MVNEKFGCETPQTSAAWPKCSSLAYADRYFSFSYIQTIDCREMWTHGRNKSESAGTPFAALGGEAQFSKVAGNIVNPVPRRGGSVRDGKWIARQNGNGPGAATRKKAKAKPCRGARTPRREKARRTVRLTA